MSHPRPPTIDDAARIASEVLAEPIQSVERFTTGSGNWVYDVVTTGGRGVVVRISGSRDACRATVFWSQTLRPLGVPLPELLRWHIPNENEVGFAWVALERFPGRDLGQAYRSLDQQQKLAILDNVLRAQKIAHQLPQGSGFGYTRVLGHAPHKSSTDVILAELDRSRRRIVEVGIVDVQVVARIVPLVRQFEPYFSSVRPIAFLDDTTTKNVIIDDAGNFRGIVDVDCICYGDPLLVPALTRMAVLSLEVDTFYADAWLDRLKATPDQRCAVDFYTAMFCVNFLSEQGQQFNLDRASAVNPREVQRLEQRLEELLRRVI